MALRCHFEKGPIAEQSTGTELQVEQKKKEEKREMFSLRNLCAVEEASVYLYFPTLERCDKGKERTSRSKSVKVHTRRKQNKIKVKQKIFHSWTVNAPRRTGNL